MRQQQNKQEQEQQQICPNFSTNTLSCTKKETPCESLKMAPPLSLVNDSRKPHRKRRYHGNIVNNTTLKPELVISSSTNKNASVESSQQINNVRNEESSQSTSNVNVDSCDSSDASRSRKVQKTNNNIMSRTKDRETTKQSDEKNTVTTLSVLDYAAKSTVQCHASKETIQTHKRSAVVATSSTNDFKLSDEANVC